MIKHPRPQHSATRKGRMLLAGCLAVMVGLLSACGPQDMTAMLNGCYDMPTVLSILFSPGSSSAPAPGQGASTASLPVADNATVEKYVKYAEDIADDDSHGYSQSRRNGNPDYDCSSLVWYALKAAGFTMVPSYPFATTGMDAALKRMGFQEFSWGGNLSRLQRGDILVNAATHTEIYEGRGRFVAAHSAENGGIDGAPGDQTHHEISSEPSSGAGKAYLNAAYRYTGAVKPAVSTAQSTVSTASSPACPAAGTATVPAASMDIDKDYHGDGRHATPMQAKALAKRYISQAYKDWDDDKQWNALVWVWGHESGWRWDATNPSSGAYGIPQALGPGHSGAKMASTGDDWHDNALTQIKWGLQYIKSRYHDPFGAQAFWQTHHWY